VTRIFPFVKFWIVIEGEKSALSNVSISFPIMSACFVNNNNLIAKLLKTLLKKHKIKLSTFNFLQLAASFEIFFCDFN
jgi:hypothetical protein